MKPSLPSPLPVRPLLLAALVAVAGCGGSPDVDTSPTPDSPDQPSPVTTTARSGTPSPTTQSPSPETATPRAASGGQLPPGVSEESGITNVTALLDAHTAALVETGFVTATAGNATVKRQGVLVDVDIESRTRATANGTVYRYEEVTVAGPLRQRAEGWSNGSIEHRREGKGEAARYSTRPHRPRSKLASRWLLASHLRAGNYSVERIEEAEDHTLVTLVATTYDNETAVRKALPENAESIRSFNATAAVDLEGRVHSFAVAIGYTIEEKNATLRLRYTVTQLGNVTVRRPEWVDANATATTETPTDSSGLRPGGTEPGPPPAGTNTDAPTWFTHRR